MFIKESNLKITYKTIFQQFLPLFLSKINLLMISQIRILVRIWSNTVILIMSTGKYLCLVSIIIEVECYLFCTTAKL